MQCVFNHEVDYCGDAALVEKLRSLPDFLALKAFLVEVLEPPPRPPKAQQAARVTPLKRRASASHDMALRAASLHCTRQPRHDVCVAGQHACADGSCQPILHRPRACLPTPLLRTPFLLRSGLTATTGQTASGCTERRATCLRSCSSTTT